MLAFFSWQKRDSHWKWRLRTSASKIQGHENGFLLCRRLHRRLAEATSTDHRKLTHLSTDTFKIFKSPQIRGEHHLKDTKSLHIISKTHVRACFWHLRAATSWDQLLTDCAHPAYGPHFSLMQSPEKETHSCVNCDRALPQPFYQMWTCVVWTAERQFYTCLFPDRFYLWVICSSAGAEGILLLQSATRECRREWLQACPTTSSKRSQQPEKVAEKLIWNQFQTHASGLISQWTATAIFPEAACVFAFGDYPVEWYLSRDYTRHLHEHLRL